MIACPLPSSLFPLRIHPRFVVIAVAFHRWPKVAGSLPFPIVQPYRSERDLTVQTLFALDCLTRLLAHVNIKAMGY